MATFVFSQLQQLDSDMDRVQQRLHTLQALLAERVAVQTAEAQAQSAQSTVADCRSKLRDRELELKTLEKRISDLEKKLYGGQIRNPKELGGFEKELQMFKHQQTRLAEVVLTLMDNHEQTESQAQQAQGTWDTLRTERDQQELVWQGEQAQLMSQLAALQGQAQTLRAQAQSGDLSRYDKLRRTRGGLAVAALNGFNCGACGLAVPLETVQQVRDAETLATCDQCGRILYNPAQM